MMLNELIGESALKFPRDAKRIALLSLEEKEAFYLAHDPMDLDTIEFRRFWYWSYLLPLKIKRFVYWFKFW